jgi:hypothetical protein
LQQTLGFNQEIATEKKDFGVWDIGGKLIYGGEQNGEYFSTGTDFGINLFLKNIAFAGAIWMVNIN